MRVIITEQKFLVGREGENDTYVKCNSLQYNILRFFVNNDDVTSRKLFRVDIRFRNTRTRQNEREIFYWRLIM